MLTDASLLQLGVPFIPEPEAPVIPDYDEQKIEEKLFGKIRGVLKPELPSALPKEGTGWNPQQTSERSEALERERALMELEREVELEDSHLTAANYTFQSLDNLFADDNW